MNIMRMKPENTKALKMAGKAETVSDISSFCDINPI